MADSTPRKRWLVPLRWRWRGVGTGQDDPPAPRRRRGGLHSPRGGGFPACLALIGGLAWLLAGDLDSRDAPDSFGSELGRHKSWVKALEFSPDGRALASASL